MALGAVLVLVSVCGALALGAHDRLDSSSEVRGRGRGPGRGLGLQAVDSVDGVDATQPWDAAEEAGRAQQHKEDDSWSWRLQLPQTALSVLRECTSSSAPASPSEARPNEARPKESAAGLAACFKSLALRALERLARSHRELPLGAGFALVPDHRELSRSMADSHGSLDDVLSRRVLAVLQAYSLRLQLPSARSIRETIDLAASPADASSPSSARKRNPLGPLLVFGSSMLPVKMSLLALLALLVGKALMLSTLAFVLPALRLLQANTAGGAAGGGGGHCH